MMISQRLLKVVTVMAVSILCYHPVAVDADLDDEFYESFQIVTDANNCTEVIHKFNPLIHKPKYIVGVFDSEGEDVAFRQYNMTFAQYLTATAGRKFDPPLEFDMIPVGLTRLMELANDEKVDFTYASSAVSSCMALEYKAQPLVTIINRRNSRGHEYDLDKYGGVIFTLASNDKVNNMEDLKDKIIGAGGITMMGGGQTQFYEMVKHGLSFVADPKQVMFTGDEFKTVQGVLDGDFEIGLARTDQIERHQDSEGNVIDPDTFKVINPQTHILDDGKMFPFVSSTGLHPEWPVAALDHVPKDVSREVQEALLALREHYASIHLKKNMRCDTTPELAQLAKAASESGILTGFRSARSYFEVRTKQETAGFIRKDDHGRLHCIRGDTLYDDVDCPPEHFKLTEDEFERSCEIMGLECKHGFSCYCKPCVKAFEVDFFQVFDDEVSHEDNQLSSDTTGSTEVSVGEVCNKMSLCGRIEQTKTIRMRLRDNMKRENPVVSADMHLDSTALHMDIQKVPGKLYEYEFEWSLSTVGVSILEIFFDGRQTPESPVRIQVVERNCESDFPGERRSSNDAGGCDCSAGTMDIRGKCVESKIIAICISIAGLMLISLVVMKYVNYKNHKNDQVWLVNVDELQFDDPVEVIGQGSFGVVLLGEYRGTKVALKRAIRGSKGSKHGKKKPQISGSRSKGSETTDPNNSVGLSSIGTDEEPEDDPEVGDKKQQESQTSSHSGGNSSAPSASFGGSGSGGARSGSVSYDQNSLGFLLADFGPRSKWGWFGRSNGKDYHNRFKQSILGGASSGSILTQTWHARLCPWFNANIRAQEEFISEMRVLSRLRHPCITTVLGAVISNTHDPMLVMEYMEYGSLHDLLHNDTLHLSGEIILQMTRDIAQGMRFLHSSKPPILHGDLKGRNILIDSRFRAKLCDFGLSTKKTSRITGTPYWMAPEYLRGQTEYTTHCDIYSIGIVLYEIYARKDPYIGMDFRDTLRKVCDRRTSKRPEVPECCPPKMVDLMKKCWSPDPFFRPQAKDLDTTLLDMNLRDAEPLTEEESMQAAMMKKKRSGDMLYEIFPKHIADALKAGKKVEPEQHDNVTVVFSQIAHFGEITRDMPPFKVSCMLDRLYMAFDSVANKHQVFKVETVGDAYMGVTNLEKNQDHSHTKNAALFAIDLVIAASNILIDEDKPELGHINILAGFHSGAVVANVVGSLNPRYGLFGDTVNTASRMQTNARPNRVLCSDAAYKNLAEQAPEIPVKKRGKIAVKGKGDMMVYWIGDDTINQDRRTKTATKRGTDTKSVDFEETSLDMGEEAKPVDGKLWRQNLQSKMQDIDSTTTKKKSVAAKEAAAPAAKKGLKNVKNMRMSRANLA